MVIDTLTLRGNMSHEIVVQYHEVTNFGGGTEEEPAHRAMVTLAPGLRVFTDTYSRREGAERAVGKLFEFLKVSQRSPRTMRGIIN